MDEQITNQQTPTENFSSAEEMNFLDKITGIFSEPKRVFENVKLYGPKPIDWVVPIFILIALTISSSLIVTSHPDIKAEIDATSKKATEEALDKAVKEGKISQQQKEEQLEQIEKLTSSPIMKIVQYVSIAVFMLVFLFVLVAVYYFVWVFILKGQGSYAHGLSVYGLASFISMIEVIVVAIVSMITVKFVPGFNLLLLFDVEKGTTLSYILSKINPFTFWWLYVIGVGLSEVYSVDKSKSLIAIFGLWLVYVVIGKFIPFLSFGA